MAMASFAASKGRGTSASGRQVSGSAMTSDAACSAASPTSSSGA
jgi:hypothetical protein